MSLCVNKCYIAVCLSSPQKVPAINSSSAKFDAKLESSAEQQQSDRPAWCWQTWSGIEEAALLHRRTQSDEQVDFEVIRFSKHNFMYFTVNLRMKHKDSSACIYQQREGRVRGTSLDSGLSENITLSHVHLWIYICNLWAGFISCRSIFSVPTYLEVCGLIAVKPWWVCGGLLKCHHSAGGSCVQEVRETEIIWLCLQAKSVTGDR